MSKNLLVGEWAWQIPGPHFRPMETDSQVKIFGICNFETSAPGASSDKEVAISGLES